MLRGECRSNYGKLDIFNRIFQNFDNFEVYMNSMVVSVTALVGYLIASGLINLLGQNKLLGKDLVVFESRN